HSSRMRTLSLYFFSWIQSPPQKYSRPYMPGTVPSTSKIHSRIPDKNKLFFCFSAFPDLHFYRILSAMFRTERKLAAQIGLHCSCIDSVDHHIIFTVSLHTYCDLCVFSAFNTKTHGRAVLFQFKNRSSGNRFINKHSVALQFRDLPVGFDFINISLMLVIRYL